MVIFFMGFFVVVADYIVYSVGHNRQKFVLEWVVPIEIVSEGFKL